jgi:hypothetical protein
MHLGFNGKQLPFYSNRCVHNAFNLYFTNALEHIFY